MFLTQSASKLPSVALKTLNREYFLNMTVYRCGLGYEVDLERT